MRTKSLIAIIIALNSWLPWTPEALRFLAKEKALIRFSGQPAYARGECCLFDPPGFMVNSQCETEDLGMVSLHETQHLLGQMYTSESGDPLYDDWARTGAWEKFSRLAIECAKETEPQEMPAVYKFSELWTGELHAQLPWLLKGKLCPKLQPWYPWFDLG